MPDVAIIVVTGDGLPKLYTDGRVGNGAALEAYDTLKRGVLGHFQVVGTDSDTLSTVAGLLPPA